MKQIDRTFGVKLNDPETNYIVSAAQLLKEAPRRGLHAETVSRECGGFHADKPSAKAEKHSEAVPIDAPASRRVPGKNRTREGAEAR